MLDTRPLLPSEAKKRLTELLLRKLEEAPLNYYQDPVFAYPQAQEEILEEDEYAKSIVFACYEEALRQYEGLHPKRWDNEKQKAFR